MKPKGVPSKVLKRGRRVTYAWSQRVDPPTSDGVPLVTIVRTIEEDYAFVKSEAEAKALIAKLEKIEANAE